MAGRSKLLTYGLPAVGLTALAVGTTWVWADQPVDQVEVPPRAPVESPGAQGLTDATRFIGATGLTEPAGEAVAIAAHTGGVVASVVVVTGDEVTAGQTLLTLDVRAAEAALARARATHAVAVAERESLAGSAGPARAELAAAEAGVTAARAALAAAQSRSADAANRRANADAIDDPRAISAERVASRGFAAESALADAATATAAVEQAVARRQSVAASLALLEAGDGSPGPRLRAAAARVDEASAAVRSAETERALRTVASPVDGTVLRVDVRAGEYAAAGSAGGSAGTAAGRGLITLAAAGPLRVRTQIDEVDIARFDAEADAWASPRGATDGRVPLTLHHVERLVVPKTSLSGSTRERIDTRVLEVVYELPADVEGVYVGQQMDVFISAGAADAESGG